MDSALVDDTHAYIFMECQGGNPVLGGNVSLVAVDRVDSPNQFNCSPHSEVTFWLVKLLGSSGSKKLSCRIVLHT